MVLVDCAAMAAVHICQSASKGKALVILIHNYFKAGRKRETNTLCIHHEYLAVLHMFAEPWDRNYSALYRWIAEPD